MIEIVNDFYIPSRSNRLGSAPQCCILQVACNVLDDVTAANSGFLFKSRISSDLQSYVRNEANISVTSVYVQKRFLGDVTQSAAVTMSRKMRWKN